MRPRARRHAACLLLSALFAVGGCDDGGGSTSPDEDAATDADRADAPDAADAGDGGDAGDAGDAADAPDATVVDGPGLEARPTNPSCLAPPRPPSTAQVRLEPAFANLSFTQPVWAEQPPNDASRWYVVSQQGRILTFPNEADATDAQVALDLTDRVVDGGERGLLGLAFHPDWPQSAEIFVSYTTDVAGQLTSRISRIAAADDAVTFDKTTESVIFEVDQPAGNHNGGQIGFGPDRLLYIALGDGGGAGDTYGNGQNADTVLGAILRIDVLGDQAPYGIPADNPFADGGGAAEIYAWGLRNPWRFSFDRATGELWTGDVGQNAWEEVNLIERGGNYGWPAKEGTHCFDANPCDVGPWIDPVVEYPHSAGRSITGGYVYRGSQIPALVGSYLYADFGSGRIWRVAEDPTTGERTGELLVETGLPIGSFAQTDDGELVVLSYSGGLYRLVDAAGGPATAFPQRLSQTGCVDPQDPSRPAPGLIPFAPNAPFWSDGAEKRRWMALPEAESATVGPDGDWTFPVGTVLVKDFRVGGRIVETRLLVHHDDGWAGYTYAWRADGTDADLLQAGEVRDIGGGQRWLYPSRGDCMRCHTEAAGFALGPQTGQLNGPLLYPSTRRIANQLVTLRAIGAVDGLADGPAEAMAAMAEPFGQAPVAERARAYLHTNCAQCHRPGAAGVREPFDLRWQTPLADANVCDVAPADYDLGVADARRLAPGEPARSLLWLRMQRRDAHGMPPLGSLSVDQAGADLLARWISALQACP